MNPVRLIRHQAALTQDELARVAGTSQPAIASYEAERKSPTMRTLQRLADASGVLVDVRVFPRMTREERRSLALHTAIAEHLRAEPESVLALARSNLERMIELHPGAIRLLRETGKTPVQRNTNYEVVKVYPLEADLVTA